MGFFRNFLKGASLTTALFVFQACYGTPKWLHDEDMSFRVVSAVIVPVTRAWSAVYPRIVGEVTA